MAHTATKLRIILPSLSSSLPRKELLLYLPPSQNHKRESFQPSSDSDSRSSKRCKVMVSSDADYSSATKIEPKGVVAEKDSRKVDEDVAKVRNVTTQDQKRRVSKTPCEEKEKRVDTKDSRFLCEEKKMKMSNVITTHDEVSAVNTDQYPTKTKSWVGARTSRNGKMKKKKKSARVVMKMDHSKKMQCWVILKRFMTGRDSWVFKEPMMGLEILDHHNESKSLSMKPLIKSEVVCNNETSMKPSSLKDIESKLRKMMYTNPDEFADDIRVVFSYGFLHPPRNDIYKITRRLSEGFELTWKSLKDKWLSQSNGAK